jgi:hypothetical protein
MGSIDPTKYQGGEHFAQSILSDSKLMKELFPNIKPEDMPSASLVGQLADLKKALKKEYDLDNILSQKKDLIARGQLLKTTTSEYIKERDTYISQIDKMLDDAKAKMIQGDMANPEKAAKMTNYLKYLETLKARQNKRYIDYSNQAIEAHNAEITRIDNEYTTNLNAFEEELQTQAAITQERYTNMRNMLKEMWDNVDKKEEHALDIAYKQAQIDAMYAKNSPTIDIDTYKQKNLILDAMTEDNEEGKPGELIGSIQEMVDNVSNGVELGDPVKSTLMILGDYIKPQLASPNIDASTFIKRLDNYTRMLLEYQGNLGEENTREKQYAYNVAKKVAEGADEYLQNYVKSADLGNIKDALKRLTGQKGWIKFKGGKEELVDKGEDEMEKFMLGALFDSYEANKAIGNNDTFQTYLDENGDNQVVDKIDDLTDSQFKSNIVDNIIERYYYASTMGLTQ